MTQPLLQITKLASGYGDIQVLHDLDLSVSDGEICCVVGSNGAGKSTLLRTISGLLATRSGRISMFGQDLTNASARDVLKAGIAHVPEGRRLFKGLSVRDNLLLGAYHLHANRSQIQSDLQAIYRYFPILEERQHQAATTLSGGEQQMCAIGRGLMARPRLLMIDELSLGLSPVAVERLCDSLREIRRSGVSILLVEQDVLTAFELAERAFVLESGTVSLAGPSEVLANDPQVRQAYMGI
jgi:branched-chain amino acid transport system ATP-binding protein